LMPIFGFFEIPFSDGRTDPEARELAKLWEDFFDKDLGQSLSPSSYKFARVIPATTRTISIDQKLDEKSAILNWENVKEYVESAVKKGKKLALLKCSCRIAFQNCDRPVEGCIAIGSAADYFLHRKKAVKELDLTEALDTLKKNLQAGLVLTTNNLQFGGDFICSCCTCCCVMLRSVKRYGNQNVIEKSNYIPKIDRDQCTECKMCVDMCQFGAWTNDIEFIKDKCVGCGVCEVNCPVEAISMEKEKDLVPAKNAREMWEKVAATVIE